MRQGVTSGFRVTFRVCGDAPQLPTLAVHASVYDFGSPTDTGPIHSTMDRAGETGPTLFLASPSAQN